MKPKNISILVFLVGLSVFAAILVLRSATIGNLVMPATVPKQSALTSPLVVSASIPIPQPEQISIVPLAPAAASTGYVPTPDPLVTPPTVDPRLFIEAPPGATLAPTRDPNAPTQTPVPSSTPLPTVSVNETSPFASQNIQLAEPITLVAQLRMKDGQALPMTSSTIDVGWSPDGALFTGNVISAATAPNGSSLYLFDRQGHEVRMLARIGSMSHWSPSGNYIAYYRTEPGSPIAIFVENREGTQRWLAADSLETQRSISWINEEELLYEQGNNLMAFSIITGTSSKILDLETTPDPDIVTTIYAPTHPFVTGYSGSLFV